MKVRFRLRAAQQLEDLVDFYDSLSSTVRRKLQRAVEKAILDIQQSPLTCLSVTEKTRMKIIRRFKIGIFFETTISSFESRKLLTCAAIGSQRPKVGIDLRKFDR